MEQQKYITAHDVAQMLGTTRQTIINYVKTGELKGQKLGNAFYVDKDYFEAIMPDVKDLVRLTDELRTVNRRLQGEIAYKNRELKNYTDDGSWLHFLRTNKANRELLTTFVERVGEAYLTNRELTIMRGVVNEMTTRQIADGLGLTTARINSLFLRALAKIKNAPPFSDTLRENMRLQQDNETLSRAVERLTNENAELSQRLNGSVDGHGAMTDDDIRMAELLSTPIRDLNLPKRVENGLNFAQLGTLADVVTLNRADLLRIRNLGKTSRRQLEEFLEDINLSLGMPKGGVDRLMKRYATYLASRNNKLASDNNKEERKAQ